MRGEWVAVIQRGKRVPRRRLFVATQAEGVAAQVRDWTAGEALTVTHFAQGRPLLRHLDYETPDLLLLDLTLPRFDGLTLLRLIRPRAVPVVLLSPNTMEGARAAMEALAAGAADCLLKKCHRGCESLAMTRAQFRRRLAANASPAPEAERRTRMLWCRLVTPECGGGGWRVVPERPFAESEARFTLALSTTRALPVLLRELGSAPPRLPQAVLLATGLPPRFTRALTEIAARVGNRTILNVRSGERLRPGQWRVIPGRTALELRGGGSGLPGVGLSANRATDEEEALARHVGRLERGDLGGIDLALFDPPGPRLRRELPALAAAGVRILAPTRALLVDGAPLAERAAARPGKRNPEPGGDEDGHELRQAA